MDKERQFTGRCNCGRVAFKITGKVGPVGQCHCSKCRRASGTDGNAVFYTSFSSLAFLSGEGEVSTFDNDGWIHTFCSECGSPTPHTDAAKKIWFVPAGLMNGDIGHEGYAAHIHVGSKAPWVKITDDAPQFNKGFENSSP